MDKKVRSEKEEDVPFATHCTSEEANTENEAKMLRDKELAELEHQRLLDEKSKARCGMIW